MNKCTNCGWKTESETLPLGFFDKNEKLLAVDDPMGGSFDNRSNQLGDWWAICPVCLNDENLKLEDND